MTTFYYAEKANGDYIFDNFPKNLIPLITDFKESQQIIEVVITGKKTKARIGKKKNAYGTIYVLTTEQKYLNRYKLFKELVELSAIAIEPISIFQNKLIEKHNSDNQEFIHNVTSLNSYSIQSLFALIPQNKLTGNINKQVEAVKDIINEKPIVASKTLLKLIKYSLATKVEFSVFERTMKLHQVSQKTDYPIREMVLSILQIFMEDFDERNITVSLDACDRRISLDYDSLFVSFYYILDNAVKYCCPNTDFKIIFKEENDCFAILIIMISVRIEDHEIQKLHFKGYRSDNIKSLNKEGNGIGMYRILKTLKFNDADLEITPRINNFTRKVGDVNYEANQFKIKFVGQQDWFRKNWV